MDINILHPWNVPLDEAVRLQNTLRERLILQPPPDFDPRLAAGADVSSTKTSDTVYAGFVILDMADMTTTTEAVATVEAPFPYVPGFLSFRELPALAEAWRLLEVRPDVLIIDGHGTAHPRRMGIACHAGLVFGVPTIGCAKSILVGTHGPMASERGATAPLIHRKDVVGMAVRTRTNISPVYVSPGHLMDLETAVEIILRLTPNGRYRQPETTRRAHRLVNEVRRAAVSSGQDG